VLIAISALTFSTTDHVMFDAAEDSDIENTTRRVGRTATLDGGCLITDGGFSDSDRTFRVTSREPLSDSEVSILRALHQDHTLVNLTVPGGVFKGVMQQFTNIKNTVSLTILCKEKLSA
jgi:hypothetical protein